MSEVVRAGDDGRRTNLDMVFEAVCDLHTQEQVATRETIRTVTGLPLTVIDDRISCLIDRGKVHRVQRGVFVPTPNHPPARTIAKYLLPDGTVKIEVGDDHVLTLTPRENRALGEMMMAAGQQFAAIALGHQAEVIAADLSLKVRRLEREVRALRALANQPDSLQRDIFEPVGAALDESH